MKATTERERQRNDLSGYLERVAHFRRLVQLGEIDPAEPTHYGPGSDEKMLIMTLRDEMGLPLCIDGDSQDCACRTNDLRIFTPASQVPVIRRMMIGVPRVRNMRVA